jgi:flagellar hook-associated protein 2
MSALTPLRFTGISSFSEDFQAILNRASQIAALPIKHMQNEQANLITKKQSLTALNTNLSSLTSAVRTLGELGENQGLSLTSSNTSKVSVINNGIDTATTYTISDITSVATAASETTVSGLPSSNADAVDGDGILQLVAGANTYSIDLSTHGNHLDGLAQAINAAGAGVTATVLNTGSNYYLSLTSSTTGATTLALRSTAGDSGSNILTATNQGSNAVFKLNGLDVSKSDNVVSDAIPGITFTIHDTTDPGETVSLIAASSRGDLANALTSLVTAYNATYDKLKLQIGEDAGLLSGDYIIGQVRRTLMKLTGYQGEGDGTITSLTDLGIELDKNGVMSFNSIKFYSLSSATIADAFDFLGSTTSGFGANYGDLITISDPVSGLIRTQQDNYDASDSRLQSQIDDLAARIERSQLTLQSKLQQADVLLSSLQSQQSLLENSFKSVQLVTFGKNNE